MRKAFVAAVAGLAVVGVGVWQFAPQIRAIFDPAAVASATPKPGTEPGSSSAPIPVDIQTVSRGKVQQQIEAVGSLRSEESVILRPEIAGRIAEILFDEGRAVKRGEPLVRLDAAIARAQVSQARASIVLSRANFERARELFQRGAGTQRALDEATAKLSSDEASLALAQAVLDKSTIAAPFDGVAGLRQVSVGDYVNPGQAMVNIESLDRLKVDFRVPEIYARLLAPDQAIRVRLDALPGREFEGRVYAIDPAFDANGRAAILRARLPNPDRQLRPGMFARVTLIVDERDALLVPETALLPSGTDIYVFRVVDDKAVQTKVKIGLRRDARVEILSGLSPGDRIVAEGAMKLRDGQFVRLSQIRGS
ncbi:MAG TPA: efflux RND transporter periplasmic adaptor subunit [Ferrovibrio sp.]|uniref:efflux RND transporter periplasmic adaptor subunit n=1 Tax=Ferrovibrio sp. TaxID=1917215 RepID=UPI002ED65645